MDPKNILKGAIAQASISWQDIIDELDKPHDPQIHQKALDYLKESISGLTQVSKDLNNISQADLQTAMEIVKNKKANMSNTEFEKFAEEFSFSGHKKNAQLKSLVYKGLNYGANVLSAIGSIFSIYTLLKSAYYSGLEYRKLVLGARAAGLDWQDTLYPTKLSRAIKTSSSDPKALLEITKAAKAAKAFCVEAVAFLVNVIDFVKDVLFIFLGLATFGLSLIPSVGISFIFMLIETASKGDVKSSFDVPLNEIRAIAKKHLKPVFLEENWLDQLEGDL